MNPTLAWSTRLRRRRRRPCSEPRQCLDWPPTSTASTPRRAPRPSSALCGFHRSAGWRCIPRAVHRSCHRLQTSASSTAFPAAGPALRRRSTGTSVASGTATLVPTPGGEDWPRPRGRGIVWLPVWQRGSKTPSSTFLSTRDLVSTFSRFPDTATGLQLGVTGHGEVRPARPRAAHRRRRYRTSSARCPARPCTRTR